MNAADTPPPETEMTPAPAATPDPEPTPPPDIPATLESPAAPEPIAESTEVPTELTVASEASPVSAIDSAPASEAPPDGEAALPEAPVEALGPTPVAPPPTLPPQPVPQVPPAPVPQDLSRIAQDLQIRKAQVEAVVQLLDEGNTVPFITRYRKERTGGLNEDGIRRIQERIVHLRDLSSRKQTILRTIANQGRLNDDLVAAILDADNPKRLEDLYLPFKPKKRTLATEAREKGLEPLALAIWTRDPVVGNLQETLASVVDPWKQLHTPEDVATGVRHILAELISELAEVRGPMRFYLWDTALLVSVKVETVPEGKGREYRDYYNFKEPIRFIPPHRILAVNRGEREQILRVRLDLDLNRARDISLDQLPLADHPHREFILPAVQDALERLLLPSLEREIRRELTDRAQDHAIGIFARNLRSLLLRPPLGGKRVLAIDPGIRTGCKVAVLDETGNLLEEGVIYPHQPQKKVAEAKRKLEQLVRKYQTGIVAIGNGTACRETEQLVADLISDFENRRLNPLPPESPIPPVTAETTPPPSAEPMVQSVAETVSSPVLPAVETVSETTIVSTVVPGAGEPALVSDVSTVPATSEEIVSAPAVETPATSAPPAAAKPEPEAPPISLEGLPEPPADLAYVIVIESGASDYSASPIAKEEFPNLDATARGTISIGRRLQDPLAELVKIDPQHIGVGLYQHDVKAKHLKESLEGVIESCVNTVGVDVNTASVPLLRHVSGLNQLVAREIVEYRKQHGQFSSRDQLKSVPQVGDARFTQAAGFLKIRTGDNPLDATWVHPESYAVAEEVLREAGFAPADIRDRAKLDAFRQKLNTLNPDDIAGKLNVGVPTVRDIFDALARPDRDPRDDRPQPIFRKGVLKIEDLKPGMELKGEVLNVVDFGAFVDVGLKDSGLVHISQMANRYIKSPYDVIAVGDVVPVWVISVDADMGRVSLTMIPPGQERRPQGRFDGPPRGERGERPDRPPRPPQGDRPPMRERPPQGDRAPHGERPPHGDRPPHPDRPPQDRPARPAGPGGPPGPRPGFAPRPGGGPGGGTRPGPKPRGPGAPGWRNSPKPVSTEAPKPAEGAPTGETPATPPAPPPPPKKPPRPKPVARLNDQQKTGKEPVYSFAQLAALLNPPPPKPPEPAPKPPEPAPTPTPPPAAENSTPSEPAPSEPAQPLSTPPESPPSEG